MFPSLPTPEERASSFTQVLLRKLLLALGVWLCTITTSSAATHDSGLLKQFLGVWSGKGVVVDQTGKVSAEAHKIDVALWPAKNGYGMTWTNLGQKQSPRTTIRFAAPRDHNTADISWTDLAKKTQARLQLRNSRITVLLSGETPHLDPLARYDYTLLDDGRITIRYSLTRGGKTLERLTALLYRAKVVM